MCLLSCVNVLFISILDLQRVDTVTVVGVHCVQVYKKVFLFNFALCIRHALQIFAGINLFCLNMFRQIINYS